MKCWRIHTEEQASPVARNKTGYVGLVRFSEEGHIIPANKAGGIVALRPDFQPIAKRSDYIDPGSFVYLRQNP
jgi:hypothetical protein